MEETNAVVAALAGAAVGIIGTGLVSGFLQRARHRREDARDLLALVGVARAISSELRETRFLVKNAIENASIPTFTRFPFAVWQQSGHRIAAALDREQYVLLLEVFGRLGALNNVLASVPDKAKLPVRGAGEPAADADAAGPPADLPKFLAAIERAIAVLERREAELETEAARLNQGWRERLRALVPKATPEA